MNFEDSLYWRFRLGIYELQNSKVDIPPTILEAAGIDPTGVNVHSPDAQGKTGFDGRSVLSILLGQNDQHRDYVANLRGGTVTEDLFEIRK